MMATFETYSKQRTVRVVQTSREGYENSYRVSEEDGGDGDGNSDEDDNQSSLQVIDGDVQWINKTKHKVSSRISTTSLHRSDLRHQINRGSTAWTSKDHRNVVQDYEQAEESSDPEVVEDELPPHAHDEASRPIIITVPNDFLSESPVPAIHSPDSTFGRQNASIGHKSSTGDSTNSRQLSSVERELSVENMPIYVTRISRQSSDEYYERIRKPKDGSPKTKMRKSNRKQRKRKHRSALKETSGRSKHRHKRPKNTSKNESLEMEGRKLTGSAEGDKSDEEDLFELAQIEAFPVTDELTRTILSHIDEGKGNSDRSDLDEENAHDDRNDANTDGETAENLTKKGSKHLGKLQLVNDTLISTRNDLGRKRTVERKERLHEDSIVAKKKKNEVEDAEMHVKQNMIKSKSTVTPVSKAVEVKVCNSEKNKDDKVISSMMLEGSSNRGDVTHKMVSKQAESAINLPVKPTVSEEADVKVPKARKIPLKRDKNILEIRQLQNKTQPEQLERSQKGIEDIMSAEQRDSLLEPTADVVTKKEMLTPVARKNLSSKGDEHKVKQSIANDDFVDENKLDDKSRTSSMKSKTLKKASHQSRKDDVGHDKASSNPGSKLYEGENIDLKMVRIPERSPKQVRSEKGNIDITDKVIKKSEVVSKFISEEADATEELTKSLITQGKKLHCMSNKIKKEISRQGKGCENDNKKIQQKSQSITEITKMEHPVGKKHEKGIERRNEKGIESKNEKGIERRNEKGIESKNEKGIERRNEKGIESKNEKGIERRNEKGIESKNEKGIERKNKKGIESSNEKGIESKNEKGIERKNEKSIERKNKKGIESSNDKGIESKNDKGIERKNEKGIESKNEKGIESNNAKGIESRSEKGIERKNEKGIESMNEKGIEVRSEKGIERKNEKGIESKNEKGIERKLEKGIESKNDKSIERKNEKGSEKKGIESIETTKLATKRHLDGKLDQNEKSVMNSTKKARDTTEKLSRNSSSIVQDEQKDGKITENVTKSKSPFKEREVKINNGSVNQDAIGHTFSDKAAKKKDAKDKVNDACSGISTDQKSGVTQAQNAKKKKSLEQNISKDKKDSPKAWKTSSSPSSRESTSESDSGSDSGSSSSSSASSSSSSSTTSKGSSRRLSEKSRSKSRSRASSFTFSESSSSESSQSSGSSSYWNKRKRKPQKPAKTESSSSESVSSSSSRGAKISRKDNKRRSPKRRTSREPSPPRSYRRRNSGGQRKTESERRRRRSESRSSDHGRRRDRSPNRKRRSLTSKDRRGSPDRRGKGSSPRSGWRKSQRDFWTSYPPRSSQRRRNSRESKERVHERSWNNRQKRDFFGSESSKKRRGSTPTRGYWQRYREKPQGSAKRELSRDMDRGKERVRPGRSKTPTRRTKEVKRGRQSSLDDDRKTERSKGKESTNAKIGDHTTTKQNNTDVIVKHKAETDKRIGSSKSTEIATADCKLVRTGTSNFSANVSNTTGGRCKSFDTSDRHDVDRHVKSNDAHDKEFQIQSNLDEIEPKKGSMDRVRYQDTGIKPNTKSRANSVTLSSGKVPLNSGDSRSSVQPIRKTLDSKSSVTALLKVPALSKSNASWKEVSVEEDIEPQAVMSSSDNTFSLHLTKNQEKSSSQMIATKGDIDLKYLEGKRSNKTSITKDKCPREAQGKRLLGDTDVSTKKRRVVGIKTESNDIPSNNSIIIEDTRIVTTITNEEHEIASRVKAIKGQPILSKLNRLDTEDASTRETSHHDTNVSVKVANDVFVEANLTEIGEGREHEETMESKKSLFRRIVRVTSDSQAQPTKRLFAQRDRSMMPLELGANQMTSIPTPELTTPVDDELLKFERREETKLDARIRRIREKNAAIMKRQREINEDIYMHT